MEETYQKVLFWSLLPAILVVPIWIAAGRCFMGGPGGWGTIIFMGTVSPVLLIVHAVLFCVALGKNRKRDILRPNDYYLTATTSKALSFYYASHFLLQIFMDDGGDQGTMGSIAENHLGMSGKVADDLGGFFLIATLLLLILVTVLICREPAEIINQTSEGFALVEMETPYSDAPV